MRGGESGEVPPTRTLLARVVRGAAAGECVGTPAALRRSRAVQADTRDIGGCGGEGAIYPHGVINNVPYSREWREKEREQVEVYLVYG